MSAERRLNFLFATLDAGGNIPPTMAVVAALAARGHRVRVMSDEVNRKDVEAAGAILIPWTRAPNKVRRQRETEFRDWEYSPPQTVRMLLGQLSCGLALPYAQDAIEELEREPADLVVNWDGLFGVSAACEVLKQKLALLGIGLSIAPLPGVPPMTSAMPPARTPEQQARFEALSDFVFGDGLEPLNAARHALGLPPLRHILDQNEIAAARFVGTARAFDFPATNLPPDVRYTGPLLRDPGWVEPWTPPWTATDQRPLVVIGFSTTFQDHVACLQRVIDACADLPVRALVTLGSSIEPGEVTAAPNTFIVDSAPHSVVIPEARVVVTHGGHGTVMNALTNRKPMLVVPHGRDQGDNAVRITERGAGLSLPNTASAAEMRAAIGRLLDEPGFAIAARRLGDAVAAEIETSTLIEDLESCCALRAA